MGDDVRDQGRIASCSLPSVRSTKPMRPLHWPRFRLDGRRVGRKAVPTGGMEHALLWGGGCIEADASAFLSTVADLCCAAGTTGGRGRLAAQAEVWPRALPEDVDCSNFAATSYVCG